MIGAALIAAVAVLLGALLNCALPPRTYGKDVYVNGRRVDLVSAWELVRGWEFPRRLEVRMTRSLARRIAEQVGAARVVSYIGRDNEELLVRLHDGTYAFVETPRTWRWTAAADDAEQVNAFVVSALDGLLVRGLT